MSVLPEEFTERLGRVVRLARTQRTLPTQLEAAVSMAKRTVATCHAAGITLIITGKPTTAAATDGVVLEVDLVQYQTGEGPCLEAIAESNVVRVDLIERETRYSRFAPGALDTAINSVVSFPLEVGARTIGAFNLYSYGSDAFDDETERLMRPIVDYAADVLSRSPLYAYSLETVEGLLDNMDERAIIANATGILMARHDLDSIEAFNALRDRALVNGSSLRQAAEALVQDDTSTRSAQND